MKLTLLKDHASITSLPRSGIELGRLTVITGRNGSGKSHLLEAIENGSVATDIATTSEIQRRDWSSFAPHDVPPVDTRTSRMIRRQAWKQFLPVETNYRQFYNVIRQFQIDITDKPTRAALLELDAEALAYRLPQQDPETRKQQSEVAFRTLKSADQADIQNFRSQQTQHINMHSMAAPVPQKSVAAVLEPLALALGKSVFELTLQDVEQDVMTTWDMDPFQATFVQPFVDYKNLTLRNDLASVRAARGDTASVALTEEQFLAKHGEMPWLVLNRALANVRLPFEINAPNLTDPDENYAPLLTETTTKAALPFSRLSSGEKILMSLAITVYYHQDSRLKPRYPKLLLLDEVDAPLHPSMTRDFLRIIQNTLITEQGLHIILATHSPSTVALAPDDAVMIMTKDSDRLRKASKAEALNLLTEGVPTLALDISGRRQVFVESPADVAVCAKLYDVLRKDLPSGRSLEFISTVANNPKPDVEKNDEKEASDQNTGVNTALRIVEDLVKKGNQSVFSLVDADKEPRRPDPVTRLHVFAQGNRDGVENCIYDPLVLLLVLVSHVRQELPRLGIPETITAPHLAAMSAADVQPLVDKLQTFLLGASSASAVLLDVQYHGGLTLKIRADYLTHDDHALVSLIETKISGIKSYGSNNAGARMVKIIDTDMRSYPQLIPADLVETFRGLLTAETHLQSVTDRCGEGD